ncbi:DUF1508 domain-containing protein [Pseudomonas sp. 8O]|uniref:DUF1508 domain-containing protein n=1 Tax=Pseudomonas sp. 8O TaxID=2653165 RepID=UPI0012F29D1A|nr:conserved hypothetical protein [Pseudomonas sp. 8O]
MLGTFELKQTKDGNYHFNLLSSNGQVLLSSELYKHKESAINGIESVKKNGGEPNRFQLKATSSGKYYFFLKASNGQVLGQSQMYANSSSAFRGISEVVRHLKHSSITDLSKQNSIEKIGSVTTFLKIIGDISSDTNSVLFYRGHGDSKYTLAPSIFRNSGWVTNEHVMFHELALRCPGDFHNSKSTFNSLVKMQHYSLPTRLLDITSNPLIALYFACAGSQSEEGEVIVFSVKKSNIKYYDSDTVSVVSNISRMHSSFAIPEEADPSKFNKLQEVDSLVREIQREKPYFEPRIKPEDINTVLCVKPILDNPRIIKQDGAFFLFGMGKDKTIPAEIPNNLLVSKDKNRLLIPSHNKSKILKQLELLGVSRSSIFPEIEHVANFIKESYKDK